MTELQKSPQVDLKGYLLRYETFKGRSGWKKRWAVLCDFCLYLYKDSNSKECFFALLLPSSRVTQSHDSSGQYRSSIKVEEPNQQPVYLSTETPLDFEMWFDALSAASQMQKIHGQPSQPQQYSSHTERTVTTTTTTAEQQQQEQQLLLQQQRAMGGDASMLRNQYGVVMDHRDDSGGRGSQQLMEMRTSQPTLASADGQYSVRQVRDSRGAGVGANGAAEGRVEITTTVEQRSATYGGGGSRSGSGLVRAEPIVASQQQQQQHQEPPRRPSALLTGRYEVQELQQQQQQHQQQQFATSSGSASRIAGGSGSYGVAGTAGGSLGASNFSINRRAIETVREDPQMDESDIIATAPLDEIRRKYPVSGLAKRMSIAASDLLGKSHDELLLLLIQLNREKASLERRRDYCQALLRRQPDMRGGDRVRGELRDIENQIELHDPLISFIDNIISMGSLYSGDDVMFASEYRQHLLQPGELKPVKANVGFLRRQQEREISRQFSDGLSGALDSVDATVGNVESQEFTKTRQQLEAELNELETVYAEHRRRKGSLATFMSELGRRAATSSSTGDSSARFGGVSGGGGSRQVSGSYLETDLDTGATIDLSAKFPQRRTVIRSTQEQQQRQQQKSRTMPANSNGGGGGVLTRSTTAGGAATSSLDRRVVSSVSDEVFHRQQQQQQHQQPPSARHTVVVGGGGGVGGGGDSSYGTTKTTTTTVVERHQQQQLPSSTHEEIIASRQQQQQQQQASRKEGAIADNMTASGHRIPDADEFLRQRTSRSQSQSAGSTAAGLPPGQPPPEVYVSQPQLHRSGGGGGGGGGGSGGSANHTLSVQEKLNLALGIDTTDASQQQQRKPQQSATAELGAQKPLISLDTSRYKRTTNFSADTDHGDHRDQALHNLGHFVEEMRGLERGTYGYQGAD